MPQVDGRDLMQMVAKAEELGLEYEVCEGGDPLWIDPDESCIRDLCTLAGGKPKTVCYGTDGGEFHELQHRVVCGPGDIAGSRIPPMNGSKSNSSPKASTCTKRLSVSGVLKSSAFQNPLRFERSSETGSELSPATIHVPVSYQRSFVF